MTKFFGKIGFGKTVQTSPGVFTEIIEERDYYGDFIRRSSRWENSDTLNDNLVLRNSLSIVADEYLYNHFSSIRYVEYMGDLWKVTDGEPARPRIILNFGGVYNGPEIESSKDSGDGDFGECIR